MKIHIVQKGDTLWNIAKKYGVNFEELKQMNSQLSNPDMIMPGMKIKVPTAGGSIKKEMQMGSKKEAPIMQHPFTKEKPLPIVEPPITPAPIKEAPIMPAPKEKPKAPYVPKMPQPIIPEIDINNYYTMNMQNVSVEQKPQPAPKPEIQPIIIVEESSESIESPVEMPMQEVPYQPMYPCVYCYPVTPIMPGTGLCYPGGFPVPPMMPFMQAPAPYSVHQPMPQVAGAYEQPILQGMMQDPSQMMMQPGVAGDFDDESSSFMPQMPAFNPETQGMGMGGFAPESPEGYPYMQPGYPGGVPGQMPFGTLQAAPHQPMQPMMSPMMPMQPMSQPSFPAGQVPYGYPAMGMPMAQAPMGFPMESFQQRNDFDESLAMQVAPQQMPVAPPVPGAMNDCGCGGPKMAPMPYEMGAFGPGPVMNPWMFGQGAPVYTPMYGQQMAPPFMTPFSYGPYGPYGQGMPRNPEDEEIGD
ncbi:SafA/ExsA family spore coat assembly protein [Cytobacillus sp. Hz8]|uniref:SafA/ExsA family spore coat assembly protein n=1 Tax=Cytobacillus sp. Hz8 TaxID=3347168 RepID=UPI0035DAA20D